MQNEKRLIDANALSEKIGNMKSEITHNRGGYRKTVVMVCKDGRICRFPSVRDAARMMGIPSPNIVACLKGRIKTAGGYCWKYADNFSVPTEKGEKPMKIEITKSCEDSGRPM